MKLSVVTTLFHSAPYIGEFHARTTAAALSLTEDYELIFVNDGSPDDSLQRVLELQRVDPKVVVIDLSRNFGHHRAIMTGLQHASGERVFLIDSDLEESPDLLVTYWREMQNDPAVDVVYGVQESRKGGFFERASGRAFYLVLSLLSKIDYPADSLTSRLMTRAYVEAVKKFSERELEIWGIFVLAGFRQKAVTSIKTSKGATTYTLSRKVGMAVDTITSFSNRPLVLVFLAGTLITGFALLFAAYLVAQRLLYAQIIDGWTSIIVSLWLIGGMIIFSLGIIGLYLSKMFLEIKRRPLTIVKHTYRAPG